MLSPQLYPPLSADETRMILIPRIWRWWWCCYNDYDRIRLLGSPSQDFFFHILWENNGLADKLPNQGASSTQGNIFYANQARDFKIVP